MRATLVAFVVFLALVWACASKEESNGVDVEASCRAACTPPSGTPCANESAPTSCMESCKALVSSRTGTCQQCLANTSGFRWTTCECKGPCNALTDPGCALDPNGCKICRAGRASSACHSDSQCREPAGCGGFALASITPVDPDAGAPVPNDCSDSCH